MGTGPRDSGEPGNGEPGNAEPDSAAPGGERPGAARRGRLPRSDEDELDGRDFAGEHAGASYAEQLRGGPERVVDEAVPSGLAGQDPNEADR